MRAPDFEFCRALGVLHLQRRHCDAVVLLSVASVARKRTEAVRLTACNAMIVCDEFSRSDVARMHPLWAQCHQLLLLRCALCAVRCALCDVRRAAAASDDAAAVTPPLTRWPRSEMLMCTDETILRRAE